MRTKEKATLGGISAEGSDGQQTVLPGFELSTSNCIMQDKKNQPAIAGLLLTGVQNAVTLSQLARIIGRDTRTVRLLIRRDRAAGFPICVDNVHGYYLPTDESERTRCVQAMLHRAQEVQRTAEFIERGTL